MAYLDGGRRLATVSNDKTLKIWDATTGEVVLTLRGQTQDLTGLACSPDGRRLASVSQDRTVKIWNALKNTGKNNDYLIYRGHKAEVNSLAWSPDGKYIASGGDDTMRTRTSASDS